MLLYNCRAHRFAYARKLSQFEDASRERATHSASHKLAVTHLRLSDWLFGMMAGVVTGNGLPLFDSSVLMRNRLSAHRGSDPQ